MDLSQSHTPSRMIWVDVMKLFLILEVVLIHSNISVLLQESSLESSGLFALDFVKYLSQGLSSVAVPLFFILSGFLFFKGVRTFTWQIYVTKMRRRVVTMLVPYLIWCMFGGVLFLAKVFWLGYDGYDIIVNGHVNWLKWLAGFWSLLGASMPVPFAFAFWFLRNLIAFVILSPLANFVGRNIYAFVIFIVLYIFKSDIIYLETFGFEWFVSGVALTMLNYDSWISKRISYRVIVGTGIIWSICAYIPMLISYEPLINIIEILKVLSAGIFIWQISLRFVNLARRSTWFRNLVKATFWIYAVHQFFCLLIGRFWIATIGPRAFMGVMMCYMMDFVTLLSISLLSWVVMRRFSPRLVDVLTGGRASASAPR